MYYLFILIGLSLAICSSEPIPKGTSVAFPSGGTLNFTVYVNNNQDAKANNSTNLISTQLDKKKDAAHSLVKKLLEPTAIFSQSIRSSGSSLISSYKWHLLGITLITAYTTLFYYVWSGNRFLSDAQLWSSWRQDLTLEQLLAVPQQHMCQDLLKEIQRRHTDSASLLDITKPLVAFVIALEQEEQQLKSYQSLYSWLSYLKLTKIVPCAQARFTKLTERLQRLTYFKNIFQSWAAEYQLEHTNNKRDYKNQSIHRVPDDIDYIHQKLNAQIRMATMHL